MFNPDGLGVSGGHACFTESATAWLAPLFYSKHRRRRDACARLPRTTPTRPTKPEVSRTLKVTEERQEYECAGHLGSTRGPGSGLQASSFWANVGFSRRSGPRGRVSSVIGPLWETFSFAAPKPQPEPLHSTFDVRWSRTRRLPTAEARGPFPTGVGFFGLARFSNTEVVRDGVEVEYAVDISLASRRM